MDLPLLCYPLLFVCVFLIILEYCKLFNALNEYIHMVWITISGGNLSEIIW